ncbi:hypothetical protein NDI44_11595 [Trichocoleus sp. DQ-A3]|uniref:hypothetical protein n=1 Tax=Cyanophyceae TaxID=3028117 RepID=UPI00168642A7|nr:hypothetical protein [Coleofasciculus sp. FACHB-125]MBD1902739.1 hypothetical protein [Coleofasciculus sp. FACHB-125]
MPKRQLMPLAATISFLTGLGIAAPSVSAATFIQFNSQPGDYIGGGIAQTFTPLDGYITASSNGNGVSLNFNGDTWWNLDFMAPEGETLVLGTYEGATRYPFNLPNEPGLSVSGDGRGCNTLTGSFKVLELAYGTGGEVERFDADFEQSCEEFMPPLLGQVRYNKADAKASVDEIKQANQISEIDLKKLLEFSNKIEEFSTGLYFWSQPGDYIGLGLEQIFTPADVNFEVFRNTDNSVSFSANNFGRSNWENPIWWYLDFAAPKDMPLVTGNYGGAYRFPFQSPTHPGLSVSGDGRGCNTLTGQFIVLDAAYGSSGNVERFDAIFQQNCEGFMPPLYGRIRYNATVTSEPVESVPEPMMTLGLLGIGGLMLTQRRRLRHIQ